MQSHLCFQSTHSKPCDMASKDAILGCWIGCILLNCSEIKQQINKCQLFWWISFYSTIGYSVWQQSSNPNITWDNQFCNDSCYMQPSGFDFCLSHDYCLDINKCSIPQWSYYYSSFVIVQGNDDECLEMCWLWVYTVLGTRSSSDILS